MKSPVEQFDAVVIGSGFGGAMAAHRLVRAGWRVALVERGGWTARDEQDWDPETILLRHRYRTGSPLLVRQYGARRFTRVPAPALVGGQSVLYGGASMRLRTTDFQHWPLPYAEMEPWYSRAERLLGVHGDAGTDPCEPPRCAPYPGDPVDLSPPAARIFLAAEQSGFRPFRLPLAINFHDPARALCIRCNTCDGFPCRIGAKNDLAVVVLEALHPDGLEIRDHTIVRDLIVQHGRVTETRCVNALDGTTSRLAGKVTILAAGALHSPAILQRSDLQGIPRQDLIGRFLMRHCNAVAAYVFPFRTNPQAVFHKQVCLTDLYETVRAEWGTAVGVIQDIYTPSPKVLRHAAATGFKLAAGLVAGHLQNLLCIAEDEPRYENRVSLAAEQDRYGIPLTTVEHEYGPRDTERCNMLLRAARTVLRRAGGLIPYTYRIDTFSHAVGTLRMGTDPQDSVVDTAGRVHGFDNLFVTDASVLPASGGVNPSLTIAANALRVAEHIATEFRPKGS